MILVRTDHPCLRVGHHILGLWFFSQNLIMIFLVKTYYVWAEVTFAFPSRILEAHGNYTPRASKALKVVGTRQDQRA
jgi:hypothetical protein